MTVTRIDSDELPNRYLAGTLSDAEQAAFESEVVRSPETVSELEATARLKVGLAKLRETGELDEMLRPALGPSLWSGRRVVVAAAGILALAVGLMLVRFGSERTAPPLLAATVASLVDQQGSVLPVSRTVALFRKRVAGYDADIASTSAPQAVELRVLPATTLPAGQYRVTLSRIRSNDAPEPVASIARLRPDVDGFVTLFADVSRLSSGSYRLDLAGDAPDGSAVAAGAFRIQVTP